MSWHTFAADTLNWTPGCEGKGNIYRDGSMATWCVDEVQDPHHQEVADAHGKEARFLFYIDPDGGIHDGGLSYNNQGSQGDEAMLAKVLEADDRFFLAPQGATTAPFGHARNILDSFSKFARRLAEITPSQVATPMEQESPASELKKWLDGFPNSPQVAVNSPGLTPHHRDQLDMVPETPSPASSGHAIDPPAHPWEPFNWAADKLSAVEDYEIKPADEGWFSLHGAWIPRQDKYGNDTLRSGRGRDDGRVAYYDGKPVGSATWVETPTHYMLGTTWVHPDHRGKGVFNSLTQELRESGKPVDAYVWDNPWLKNKVRDWRQSAQVIEPDGDPAPCASCGEMTVHNPCDHCGQETEKLPVAGSDYQQMERQWYDQAWDEPGSAQPFPPQPNHWRQDNASDVSLAKASGSAFFTEPHEDLNPTFWDSDEHLLPEIHDEIIETFEDVFNDEYEAPREWGSLWIVGSSTSYQYEEEDDDLDVQLVVDLDLFRERNPKYANWDWVTIRAEMHAHTVAHIDGKDIVPGVQWQLFVREETDASAFIEQAKLLNQGVYDVDEDRWEIVAVKLEKDFDPLKLFEQWVPIAKAQVEKANDLVQRYREDPSDQTEDAIREFYTLIRVGRKRSFEGEDEGPMGGGQFGQGNFEWQYMVQFGPMHEIKEIIGAYMLSKAHNPLEIRHKHDHGANPDSYAKDADDDADDGGDDGESVGGGDGGGGGE